MKKHLNIDFLNTFLAVARSKNLETAAKAVYLSHSAVSMQIKSLEKQVGSPLFIREKTGLKITQQGKTLASYATKILELNDEVVHKVHDQHWNGEITVGIPTDYTALYVKYVLPKLTAEFPEYSFKTICGRSRNLRKDLSSGAINVAMVAMEPQYDDDITLWEEKLEWVCSKDFNISPSKPLSIALFSDNCVVNDYSLSSLKRSNQEFKIKFTSTMMDNLLTGVKAGLVLALLPESLVTSELKIVPSDCLNCLFSLKVGLAQSTLDDDLMTGIRQCFTEGVHEGFSQIFPTTVKMG